MTKVQLHVMLVLYNVRIKPLNVRKKKKKRKSQNLTKVLSNVMLKLYNVKMKSSNVML